MLLIVIAMLIMRRCPRGVCPAEVEAEDDVAATRPHADGVDGDALVRRLLSRLTLTIILCYTILD